MLDDVTYHEQRNKLVDKITARGYTKQEMIKMGNEVGCNKII